jgi:hypothetical protein
MVVSARRKAVVAENQAILAKRRSKSQVVAEIETGQYIPDATRKMIVGDNQPIIPFNHAIATKILDQLAVGATINWISEQQWFPGMRSIRSWKALDPQFKADYASALKDGTEVLVGVMIEISMAPSIPGDMANEGRRKTATQNLLWYLERRDRHAFGQHVAMAIDHTEKVDINIKFDGRGLEAFEDIKRKLDQRLRPKLIEGTVDGA